MVCTDGYAPRVPCGRQFPMRNEICASSEAGEPKASCSDGYVPRGGEVKYNLETRCEKCRLRVKCDQSWCGLTEHKVNFAVLQSSCVKCQNEELTKDSKCNSCGSRCDTCSVLRKKLIPLPCENRCGFRQRVFRGKDVPQQFCSHIKTPCYKNTVLMAHNAKGFDNYPILNCLLEKHGVKPNKIIFDGSKINYMHVSKGLDLTFLDSLNFIQMKLSKIPECFGLREVTKGYFPHLFNTGKSIVSRSVSRCKLLRNRIHVWEGCPEIPGMIHIQHALNGRGEHRVQGTNYRLDGYEEQGTRRIAYEFHGCRFHGCPSCFPHESTRTTDPPTKHSPNELYYLTKNKEMELKRRGYEYVSVWEHEFMEQLEQDEKIRAYVSSIEVTDRLDPRDSFFGGRTNDIKLYHEITEPRETIEYYDFTRSMIGTWCKPELELARSKGYRILKIYEIYNIAETKIYDRQTEKGGLFDGYVNLFLKLKEEASGFPSECETEQQKMDYIADYAKKEGILLDYDQIRKNPDPKKDVRDFHIINKNTVKTEHFDYPSFIPIDYNTNVFIASFTTCWARTSLYKVLEKTDENALYVDTDSVIFVDRNKEITNTLPIGNYLGELTNEISTEVGYITHFVSHGPKNYAYKMVSGKEKCKVRGFSLQTKANEELINISAIRDIVVDKNKFDPNHLSPKNF
ncbi:unnamed protein product [Mytilus coruscus]|uniref:Uncharacterized protein n=1 Tax=Mytilus coruscus TaxID=42192 RepID=A0A6J8DXA6_MYTCO|nr:unnamed protein product [Mytilus coruscus]